MQKLHQNSYKFQNTIQIAKNEHELHQNSYKFQNTIQNAKNEHELHQSSYKFRNTIQISGINMSFCTNPHKTIRLGNSGGSL